MTHADLLERDWQAQVVQLARTLGWARIYHTHDSRKSAHGFPDLVLVRERVLFLELKREEGRATEAQRDWLRALADGGAEVYLVRPRNLEAIAKVLAARKDGYGLSTHAAAAARRELAAETLAELRRKAAA